MSVKTPLELVREAKMLLMVHGWVKGHPGSKSSGYCLMGAIMEAGWNTRKREGNWECIQPVEELLNKYAPRRKGKGYGPKFVRYNDAKRTTKDDIIKLLDEVEARLILDEHEQARKGTRHRATGSKSVQSPSGVSRSR